MILNIIAFVIVIGVLVMVHELGHFVAAKLNGVRVDKFALGFPPKLWSKKVGETEYTINLIPAGGYVAMYGEEGGHSDDLRSYTAKKPWQKATILAAGVLMNLILAWVIFTGFYLFGGQALLPGMDSWKGVTNSEKVSVTEIVAGSPAATNGLKVGDFITSVNGSVVHNEDAVAGYIQQSKTEHPTSPVSITVVRGGQTRNLKIDTYKDTVSGKSVQRIGITMTEKGTTKSVWYLAPWVGLMETFSVIGITLAGLWGLLVGLTHFQLSPGVGGPIAIYVYSGVAAQYGFWIFAQFIAAISVSLALVNILPFPALDGGQIAILAVEAITRRKIPDQTKQAINNAGLALLLVLVVALSFHDIITFGVFAKIKGIFK